MPNATIYIRQEDWEAWKSIEKKSEWIDQMLNEYMKGVSVSLPDHYGPGVTVDQFKVLPPVTKKPKETPSVKFCQHGAAVGLCRYGCKK